MYTDVELMKVLESVEKEFNTQLAKAEEKSKTSLAKSEDKPFPPKDKKPEDKEEKKPEESKKDPKEKEGEKANESVGEERNSDDHSKQHSQEKPEDKRDEGAASAAPGDHGYDDEDMDHMHKMYMSMSKAELKAHHDSVRKALDCHGMQKCGDMAMAMSMDKSEKDTTVETSIEVKIPDLTKEHALLKSEFDAEKSKTAELQKKVDLATEFMAKLAAKKSAPQGKAITSLDVIAKSEETKEDKSLAKSEVTSILAKKSADPALSEKDRAAINDYYLGSKNIQVVKHLLA
jgi:hypothetical protein